MKLHLFPVKEWSMGGEMSALFAKGSISVTFGKRRTVIGNGLTGDASGGAATRFSAGPYVRRLDACSIEAAVRMAGSAARGVGGWAASLGLQASVAGGPGRVGPLLTLRAGAARCCEWFS
jgi:hypothetical protein